MLYGQNNQKNATLIMHYQGIGGPIYAHGSQRGPKVLLEHGLSKALYDNKFDELEVKSVFEDFPGFYKAEEIGRNLGQSGGIKANGVELVGFPFNSQSLDIALTWNLKINSNKIAGAPPLDSMINNLELLRLIHTADYLKCLESLIKGDFLIHLSGTHDGDIGSVAAVSTYLRRMGLKTGLVSFDAHGDYNSFDISPSGNLHGMHNAIATLEHMRREAYFAFLGSMNTSNPERKVNPRNILHVGGRAFDPLEIILLNQDRVNVWTMHEIEYAKSQGRIAKIFREKYHKAMYGVNAVIVSIDFDVLEPNIEEVKPGTLAVSMQEPNGLLPEDLKLMLQIIGQSHIPVVALLGSELNPRTLYDPKEKTFDVALDIIKDFFKASRKS